MKKLKSFRGGKPLANLAKGAPTRGQKRGFLRAFLSGYYPATCDDIEQHTCDPCEAPEFGRVRSAAFIKNSFVFADPTSTLEWQTGVANGDIIIIPFTNGEMPEPTAKMGTGYGDNLEELIAYDFSIKLSDPNFVSNNPFYNKIAGQRGWKLAFRTSSQTYITPITVTIVPMYKIENDLNSKIVWGVSLKWVHKNFPELFNTPENIFDECLELGE